MAFPFKNRQNWPQGIPLTGIDKILIAISVVMLIVSMVRLGMVYNDLPEMVPNHININGEADSYGRRSELFIVAGVGFACWLLLLVSNFFPQAINIPRTLATRRSPEEVVVGTRIFLNVTLVIVTAMVWYILEGMIGIALGTMAMSSAVVWGQIILLVAAGACYFFWLWRG